MKRNKFKKLFVWLTSGTLAAGLAVAVLPTFSENKTEIVSASTGAVSFYDDFSKYTEYGKEASHGGVRTQTGVGWTNQWFDGIGDGKYESACSSEYASITTNPDDATDKVLYLNTNKNEHSFFYITPTFNDEPLALKNYEIEFKFKINTSTKAENRLDAPWFGTLNRKTKQGKSSFIPWDGRYNGTFNVMMSINAGIYPSSGGSSAEDCSFYSFSKHFQSDDGTDCFLAGEKNASGVRTGLDANYKPTAGSNDSIYNSWYTYKCVVNEASFDMYIGDANGENFRHMGGQDVPSDWTDVLDKGYISIALCVMDMYIDDVSINEILPNPGVSGGNSTSMRADQTKSAEFVLVNTKSIISVKNGNATLTASDYSYDGTSKLTINKSYIDTLAVGTHTISVTATDNTYTETFDIKIIIIPVPAVAGGGNTATLPLGGGSIELENVETITEIKKGTEKLKSTQYGYKDRQLSFTSAYVGSLGVGSHDFTITTDKGDFNLTLNVKPNPEVDGNKTVQITQGDDASFTLKNVSVINSITYNGTPIATTAYSYENSVLTFKGEYTATLAKGRQAHVIKTDAGDLTVNLYMKGTSGAGGENAPSVGISELTVKADVDATFTLSMVNSIVSVATIEGKSLAVNTDYTFVNSKLTIKSTFIETLGAGTHSILVVVNDNVELDLLTINYTPALVSSASEVIYNKDVGGDVSFTFKNATGITKIVREVEVSKKRYSFDNNTLTISDDYLNTLKAGKQTFMVSTDNGSVAVSVVIEGTVTLKLILPDGSKASFASGEDGIATFDEGTATDVTFQVKGISKNDVIVIKVGENKKLVGEAYAYSNGVLTIKGAYIETLKGTKELTLVVEKASSNGGSNSGTTDNSKDDGGCGSSLGFASTMLLATTLVGGLAIARKKRK